MVNLAAREAMPTLKRSRKKTNIIWNDKLALAAAESRKAHYEWKQAGRPSDPADPSTSKRRLAKKRLRSEERQEIAIRRNELYSNIAESHYGDRVTYHRLIKLQTGKVSHPIGELVIEGVSLVDQDHILDGWNRHFGSLATPSTCQDYDRKYQQEAAVDIYILDNLAKDSDHYIKQFSQDQVYKAMRQLNKRKAPVCYELTVEHLLNGGYRLLNFITILINEIMQQCWIPPCLKQGVLTPVWKKKSNKSDPYSYRLQLLVKL